MSPMLQKRITQIISVIFVACFTPTTFAQSNTDFGPPPPPRIARRQIAAAPIVPRVAAQQTAHNSSNASNALPVLASNADFGAPPMSNGAIPPQIARRSIAAAPAVPRVAAQQTAPNANHTVPIQVSSADFGAPPMSSGAAFPATVLNNDFAPPPMSNGDSVAAAQHLDLAAPETSVIAAESESLLRLPADTQLAPHNASVDEARESSPTFLTDQTGEPTPAARDYGYQDQSEPSIPVSTTGTMLPAPRQPSVASLGWWQPHIGQPMRNESQPLPITLEQMIAAAVQHSAQIQVFSDAPLIRDTEVIEAASEFDWSGYFDSMWNDTDEPVGSTLTTGGPPRFSNHRWSQTMGTRRKTTRGGQFDVSQQMGHETSNSIFLLPNNQGTARLSISYSQPLLRGGGKVYNTSLILLAQINASIAQDEFSNQLQTQLLDVTRAYWSLYLDRGSLLQRQRLYKRGQIILTYLEKRQEIDALANQIVRARAAVSARKADLFRAAATVKNSEARIRALVNAPYLGAVDQFELLPQDLPSTEQYPVDMATTMTHAIQNRPEIHQAFKQIRGSAVRLNMAKNELLPLLDMVLETYVNGINGDSGVGQSLKDQFTDGAPSYVAGFQMELPFKNRAARSRLQRRSLESRQLQSNFEATVYALGLEVETAVREIHTTYREILAKHESMKATQSEVDYITQRWKHLTGEDRSASLLLEDLLAAQERLQNEESEFLSALVSYNLAMMNLKKVTGTLLQLEQVYVNKTIDGQGTPQLHLQKVGHNASFGDGHMVSPMVLPIPGNVSYTSPHP